MIRRDGQVLPLGGRALDILIYLVDRSGEVIAKWNSSIMSGRM
jgi:DNA-binding winged helix-turn-helix (wHTH) protein